MLAIRTILHPTDFSEPSHSAWHFAASLATCYGANLVILHVIPTPIPCSDSGYTNGDAAQGAPVNGGANGIHAAEPGNPAAEILQIARTCHADLIVMGAHSQRGLGHLAMGHVAEQVLLGATCPVLTVTIPEPAKQGQDKQEYLAAAGHTMH